MPQMLSDGMSETMSEWCQGGFHSKKVIYHYSYINPKCSPGNLVSSMFIHVHPVFPHLHQLVPPSFHPFPSFLDGGTPSSLHG